MHTDDPTPEQDRATAAAASSVDAEASAPAVPPATGATSDAGEAIESNAAAGEPTLTVDAVMDSGPAEPVVSERLMAILEALIFASPEPLVPKAIYKLLDTEPREEVDAALDALGRRYDERPGGLMLVHVAGGYQIVTRPDLNDWVRRLFHERTSQKLSVQALETLAVIAYKQPITAAEVTEIRGVNASGVVGTLLERGLIKISGRKQVVGRPFLYATTREFLDRFGLRDITDLPRVEDMAAALGFEPPAGLPLDGPSATHPSDEPATEEDQAVLLGDAGDEGEEDGAPEPPEAASGGDAGGDDRGEDDGR